MQALCGVAAVVMCVIWIIWVLTVTLFLIDPTDRDGALAVLGITIIAAPIIYGGFRLIDSQDRG